MTYTQRYAQEFAARVHAWGFRVWLSNDRCYGFVSDDRPPAPGKLTRVLSFSARDGSLSGNYGPPSTSSGTGWRMDKTMGDMRCADDVLRALNEHAPEWTRRSGASWKHYTTVAQHLAMYGQSSGYTEYAP